jgi:dTDP-4-dehydrorhamnose reductase
MAIAILGGSGLVGSRLCEMWSTSTPVIAPAHADLDVLHPAALETFIQSTSADTVVNCVAAADVDGCEPESGDLSGRAYRLNADFPRRLAEACEQTGKHLVHISTDYVFDGEKASSPYVEDDRTGALCWYAETKLRGEQAVLGANSQATIARIEMPFTAAPHPKRDLARTLAARLQAGQPVQAVTDQRITPVYLDDAAAALRHLVESRLSGVIHVAATTWTTPYDLAMTLARHLGVSETLVQPVPFEQFAATRPARRPRHSWLDVSRFSDHFGSGMLRPVEDEMTLWARQWPST